MFANKKAGEWFAARNLQAEALIEVTGDHACEYMTSGCVVDIGKCFISENSCVNNVKCYYSLRSHMKRRDHIFERVCCVYKVRRNVAACLTEGLGYFSLDEDNSFIYIMH